MENKPGNRRKVREGVVVSNRMMKTVAVHVKRTYQHPEFQKVVTRQKKYYAHVEEGTLEIGQKVRIEETRPLSKLKRWRVIGVIQGNV